MISEPTTDASN